MMLHHFIVSLSLIVVACAAVLPPSTRVVNGEDASIKDFPYQVAFLYFGLHMCGGSIIGNRYVITAAHCTDLFNETYMSVRVGSTFREDGGQLINVSHFYQHEEYNYFIYDNDISVLVLDRDIVYSDDVQPINLAETEPAAGTVCNISGWGYIQEGGPQPDNLQVAQVPVIEREACRKLYGEDRISDRLICAGFEDGHKDECMGDSGGPLVCNGVQYGLVSYKEGCGRVSRPGIYSNISALRLWIKKITGI